MALGNLRTMGGIGQPFTNPSTLGVKTNPIPGTAPAKPGGLASFAPWKNTAPSPTDDPMSLFGSRIGSGPTSPMTGPSAFKNPFGPKTPQGLPIPPLGQQGSSLKPEGTGIGVNPSTITPQIDIQMGRDPVIAGMDRAPTQNGVGDMGPKIESYRGLDAIPTGMENTTPKPPQNMTFRGYDNIPTGMENTTPKPPGFPAETDPNDLNALLTSGYADLLRGKNPAMDQANRIALNALGGQEKSATGDAAQKAARMGLAPGTPGYEQIMGEARRGVASGGSELLSGLAQKGLDQQTQNMSNAGSFQSRRDVIGAQADQSKVSTAQHIVDNPDLYKPDEVAIAKDIIAGTGLGVDSGAGSDWKNARPADSNPEASVKALEDILGAYPENAGKTPQELEALARERYKTMTESEWNAFLESGKTDAPVAPGAPGAKESDWLDKFNKLSKKINPILPDWANAATWF